MDKYSVLKKTKLPDAIIYEVASYLFTFEQIIKNELEELIPFVKKTFSSDKPYKLHFGVKWITPLSTCHKYDKNYLIPILINRFGLQYTKYDLYALAQLKMWKQFQEICKANLSLTFCYRLVFQYAREADAEAFIIWLRTDFRVINFIKEECMRHRCDHLVEHQLKGVRNVYSIDI